MRHNDHRVCELTVWWLAWCPKGAPIIAARRLLAGMAVLAVRNGSKAAGQTIWHTTCNPMSSRA